MNVTLINKLTLVLSTLVDKLTVLDYLQLLLFHNIFSITIMDPQKFPNSGNHLVISTMEVLTMIFIIHTQIVSIK